ncbi:uncharacterized protein KY384_001197 [Bacidia gigantensis]|uniref:uncharacterized protein n=1 Tax=Bacidia gigantensis TaxID=2732470 RepID=UPI001D04F6F6|nr:uncharacterized protein KY384_001197 [Bacidia gigantensis]KAG8534353.1 hypothetical protein KY384_001197 [Bacidia gigantensis]
MLFVHFALPFFLLLPFITALPSNINPRADSADADSCEIDEASTLDGPTSDKTAGLGIEFESLGVELRSECDSSKTNQAKGKGIGSQGKDPRQGDKWKLTADTTAEIAGRLTAEYILDGTKVKIGDDTATAAAAAVSGDLKDWNPYADMDNNKWDIEENECNPWQVSKPSSSGNQNNLIWLVQATAPLPFEAISDLKAEALGTTTSPLLPQTGPGRRRGVVSVTKDFFQSSPNGISSDDVKADVLGFFGVVLSYAKGATDISDNPTYGTSSPKSITSIMPRTEFITQYAQVSSSLPGSGTLYELVKVLACYKNQGDDVDIDSKFCDGTPSNPQPNKELDKYGWCLKNDDTNDKKCLKVEDWITSITGDTRPDKLTDLDKLIDGQIGGLDNALEKVIGTTRAVPLFEFRNLDGISAPDFSSNVDSIEKAIKTFHEKYKSAPSRKFKRQAASDCATDVGTATATDTATGTHTTAKPTTAKTTTAKTTAAKASPSPFEEVSHVDVK